MVLETDFGRYDRLGAFFKGLAFSEGRTLGIPTFEKLSVFPRSKKDQDPIMPISCTEYRETQQLLALKKRLAEEKLNPDQRKELEELIRKLEEQLGL